MNSELVTKCIEAKKLYQAQQLLVFPKGGNYNGRYQKKSDRLFKEWKKAEETLLKSIYVK